MIREKLAAQRSIEESGFRWRAGDVTRLEQFSDAVFAIALALIVVSTEVPKNADELFVVVADFPAFAATFAVLVWIWYGHYLYFRRFGLVDGLTTTLNAMLVFLVLFYVYPLKFLFSALFDGFAGSGWAFTFEQGGQVLSVYALGFVCVFGMFGFLYRHALRKRDELELNQREVLIVRASMHAYWIIVAIGASAGVMALFGPFWMTPVAGMMFWLLGPVLWWHQRRSERRWRALS